MGELHVVSVTVGYPACGKFAQSREGCRSAWRRTNWASSRRWGKGWLLRTVTAGERNCASFAATPIASTGCPPSLHSPQWLSTRCGGRHGQSIPTVSRVSQTPLYDQLRGERINADVPASDTDVSAGEAEQEPLIPLGLRLVPAGGPVAGTVHSVSSGSKANLTEEEDCSGQHHRRDDVHGGAGLHRRHGAEVAEGGPRLAATVPAGPAAPMPSECCVAQQPDPAVDTPAMTRRASGAGQCPRSQQPPPAFVRSPVHVRNSQHPRGC